MLLSIISFLAIITVSKASILGGQGYGYTGTNGPLFWGRLSPDNHACQFGRHQSPINLDDQIELLPRGPQLVIPALQSTLFENIGTTLLLHINGTNSDNITEGYIRYLMFRINAEHQLLSEVFEMEILLLQSQLDRITKVYSMLFNIASKNAETISNIIPNLKDVAEPFTSTTTGPISFVSLEQHIANNPVFTYSGSLAFPPCTEDVEYVVSKIPMTIDPRSFHELKSIIKFNARFIQNRPGKPNLLDLTCKK